MNKDFCDTILSDKIKFDIHFDSCHRAIRNLIFSEMEKSKISSLHFFFFLLFPFKSWGMHVESYWESWVLKDYPDDWCALLKDVPATPIGSTSGANYVSIGHFLLYCSSMKRNSLLIIVQSKTYYSA